MSDDGKNSYPKKKYSQHYRKKWEEIPQLRGWLSMFPHKDPEKTKAFCKYCQRKLVPHVTGLLKHAACRVHLKKARDYMERVRDKDDVQIEDDELNGKITLIVKNNEHEEDEQEIISSRFAENDDCIYSDEEDMPGTDKDDVQIEDDELNGKITLIVKNNEHEEDEQEIISSRFAENDDCIYSDEEDMPGTLITDPLSQQVKIRVVVDDAMMSTHVLDTTRGMPVVGLGVSLYRLQDGRWTILSDSYACKSIDQNTISSDFRTVKIMLFSSVTDAEGRCTDLLKDNSIAMQAGRYKMHYDVSQYYAIRNQELCLTSATQLKNTTFLFY
ncbi:hypothetical protein B566_EDAN016235 [Ephemera danica]|nr:hypothetical protein B566_EDAN016235 [Ephemera danica]